MLQISSILVRRNQKSLETAVTAFTGNLTFHLPPLTHRLMSWSKFLTTSSLRPRTTLRWVLLESYQCDSFCILYTHTSFQVTTLTFITSLKGGHNRLSDEYSLANKCLQFSHWVPHNSQVWVFKSDWCLAYSCIKFDLAQSAIEIYSDTVPSSPRFAIVWLSLWL